MSEETRGMGWFWRFSGGPLDGVDVATEQRTGDPPEAIVAYPSPMMADLIPRNTSGLMPVPDLPETREKLHEHFAPEEIHRYTQVNRSRITDEQYATMTHVARGAEYVHEGPLVGSEEVHA